LEVKSFLAGRKEIVNGLSQYVNDNSLDTSENSRVSKGNT
jgi:hypothetical protein